MDCNILTIVLCFSVVSRHSSAFQWR